MVKTIKKSLAVVLALAVCLSLFCAPASASNSTSANDLPYMLFDFEDNISFIYNSDRASIVEGGMGGSGHALQVVETEDVTSAEYTVVNKSGENWNATLPAGSKLQISFWVKLANPLKQLVFMVVNHTMRPTVGLPLAQGDKNSTDWQKITIDIPIENAIEWKDKTVLRFGANSTPHNPVADGQGTTTRTYLIDDFEVKVLDPNVESTTDQIENADGYRQGFESGAGSVSITSGGYWNAQSTATTNNRETIQVVNNPDGRGKVLKVDLTTDVAGDGTTLAFTNSTANSQYGGAYGSAGTLPVGATITYKFKYYWAQEMSSTNTPGFRVYRQDTLPDGTTKVNSFAVGTSFETSANEWHTATLTQTNSGNSELTLGRPALRLRKTSDNLTTWKTAEEGLAENKYGARTLYIDDITTEITLPDAPAAQTAPTSSNLVVTGNVAAGNSVSFSHTFTPASTSEVGVTDASVVRLLNVTSTGEMAVISYCGINESMLVPAIPANSAKLVFEVVPVSSDSKVGDVVTYAVPESAPTPSIVGITLTQAAGKVTIATDTDLTGAKLIFVTYGANGKMVDWESVDVLLSAQGTQEYSPLDLTPGNYTRAMLWANMTDCIPLADMIQY